MTDSTRAGRYSGRHALRKITTVPRCFDCGREQVNGYGTGLRRTAEGVVGFAGLATCGRVWLCPVCNAKVMAHRAMDLGAMLTWASLEGYHAIFGSLTVRHNIHTPLAGLIEMQQAAWRHVVQSRYWSKVTNATRTIDHAHGDECAPSCERKRETVLSGADGRIGYVRAAEITTGPNGWHPHFHPIIIWKGDPDEAQAFANRVVELWVEGVELAGGEAQIENAQQLRVRTGVQVFDELAGYVTKAVYDPQKLALEAVWSQSKFGRGRAAKTVSHWAILASVDGGEFAEKAQWQELEAATDGHRMITWSRGLRRFAGLIVDELDDEKVAAQEVGTKEDTVAVITPAGWLSVRDRPEVLALILDELESGGLAAAAHVMDEFGVEWVQIEDLAQRNAAGPVNHEEPGEDRTQRYTATTAPAYVDPDLAAELILGRTTSGPADPESTGDPTRESWKRWQVWDAHWHFFDERLLGHDYELQPVSRQDDVLAVLDELLEKSRS